MEDDIDEFESPMKMHRPKRVTFVDGDNWNGANDATGSNGKATYVIDDDDDEQNNDIDENKLEDGARKRARRAANDDNNADDDYDDIQITSPVKGNALLKS